MSDTENFLKYIQSIRTKNNALWMELLKIALEHAPEETRGVLRKIRVNDLLVSEATGKIADEDIKPRDRDGASALHHRRDIGEP